MKKLAGERAYEEITCMDGDASDCVHMGTTSHGTPVDVVRVVAEADRRICLGNIEYHYFAGYSGEPRPSCRAYPLGTRFSPITVRW